MTILKKAQADNSKQLNIRVSASLADELDQLREKAKAHGFTIDLEPAIAAAIKKAGQQLAKIEGEAASGTASS